MLYILFSFANFVRIVILILLRFLCIIRFCFCFSYILTNTIPWYLYGMCVCVQESTFVCMCAYTYLDRTIYIRLCFGILLVCQCKMFEWVSQRASDSKRSSFWSVSFWLLPCRSPSLYIIRLYVCVSWIVMRGTDESTLATVVIRTNLCCFNSWCWSKC